MIDKSKAIDKLQALKGDAKGLAASVFDVCIRAIKEMPEDEVFEVEEEKQDEGN